MIKNSPCVGKPGMPARKTTRSRAKSLDDAWFVVCTVLRYGSSAVLGSWLSRFHPFHPSIRLCDDGESEVDEKFDTLFGQVACSPGPA
jgi:hypothetical protein